MALLIDFGEAKKLIGEDDSVVLRKSEQNLYPSLVDSGWSGSKKRLDVQLARKVEATLACLHEWRIGDSIMTGTRSHLNLCLLCAFFLYHHIVPRNESNINVRSKSAAKDAIIAILCYLSVYQDGSLTLSLAKYFYLPRIPGPEIRNQCHDREPFGTVDTSMEPILEYC